jgi:hypothetical protein
MMSPSVASAAAAGPRMIFPLPGNDPSFPMVQPAPNGCPVMCSATPASGSRRFATEVPPRARQCRASPAGLERNRFRGHRLGGEFVNVSKS